MLFDLLKAIILGIIEGITEWLPISSTGHLILAEEFIKFSAQNQTFMDMFNVVIQLGAILAVIVIYFKKLNPFQPGKTPLEVRKTWQLWTKVVIAVLPSVIIGLPLDDWFDAHFYNFISIACMLILYGFIFIWVENHIARGGLKPKVTSLAKLPYKTALIIGLFQVLSLMPGTSRSGATIIGGLLAGTSRSVVTEFTFFLGIPTMFGASLLKVAKFVLSGSSLALGQWLVLLVACLTAFFVSMWAIRFLTDYVKNHDFKIFGKYRIILGIGLLLVAALQAIF
ncbi:undecaprenyl-diphosphate phosphatase [Streptococcus sp. DD12]|uniref:undecaprenyl-diphosphate phosphatase n=1 Tax=Streptococcus sp. DD12 TaxID=1777880 RepID=UPI000794D1DE|nr:undecaprenyl-diphosphate phosphatase [Streptococcus sp. DD12]KXT76006.1 Undecaprenyl-diphosphatase [Streptococcus sp. DD12]